jgi:hypothetical protein
MYSIQGRPKWESWGYLTPPPHSFQRKHQLAIGLYYNLKAPNFTERKQKQLHIS